MISIYQVRPDYRFSRILPSELSFDRASWTSLVRFDGKKKGDSWGEDRMSYLSNPELAVGDFSGFIHRPAVQVITMERASRLERFFHADIAELLSLRDQDNGTKWCAINVVNTFDCVDKERSVLNIRPHYKKLEFNLEKITRGNIFTSIWPPSLCGGILCLENTQNPETEFRAYVKESGLTGLAFELLWSEKDGGVVFQRSKA